jgi:hypothetical protein
MTESGGGLNEEEVAKLRHWRQGDFTLSIPQFVVIDGVDGQDFSPNGKEVVGLVAVSQTCDIVNWGEGKEWVILSPLIEVEEKIFIEVNAGRTPGGAILECAPRPNLVVDLNRMMTVHKGVLISLERQDGFKTDQGLRNFAEALERKHGRFAFPDSFNDHVLKPLRKRIKDAHEKNSENGRAYRSIQYVRVVASPSWDAQLVSVGFRFVLPNEAWREATRAEIAKVVEGHLGKITWPKGFQPETPPFTLQTLDEMTALEWTESRHVDWDFISRSP